MPALTGPAATQLNNILEASGKTVVQYVAAVKKHKLEKHGQIVAFFKTEHGLTHGNANLLSHVVREQLAGGPADANTLLTAQYSGAKESLLPTYEKLAKIAESMGSDVETVIQKTAVAFRRKKNFLVVKAASGKRIELGLNLSETPSGDRCTPTTGMCNHKASVHAANEVDAEVKRWIKAAYQQAG